MRAVLYDHYGSPDVLDVREVPDPTGGAVLVDVVASSVNPKDVLLRRGRLKLLDGRRFPKRVGFDVAGTVRASQDADLPVGSPVYGFLDGFAGGTHADIVAMPARSLALAPTSIPLADAAAAPLAGLTALQALRDVATVRAGQTVLVNGASGGVGVFAIQVAKHLGATVTAVSSQRNHDFCRHLGADHVHDYASGSRLPDARFDVVLDVYGNLSRRDVLPSLTPSGMHVTTAIDPSLFVAAAASRLARQRTAVVVVRPRRADLATLARLIDTGTVGVTIDHRFGLDDVRAAHEQVQSKHTRGKVVVEN